MTTLFISDLHLDPERPAITELFGRFVDDEARDAEALYILGDLFEAWVGDEGAGLRRIVVAHPGLEQVAEDVQRLGATRFLLDESAEQFGDRGALRVQVQVGDEEGGHSAL